MLSWRAAVAAASEAASAYDERNDSEAAAEALRAGQAFTQLSPEAIASVEAKRRALLLVTPLERAQAVLQADAALKAASIAATHLAVSTEAARVFTAHADHLAEILAMMETAARELRWSLVGISYAWANGRPVALTGRSVKVLTERMDTEDRRA